MEQKWAGRQTGLETVSEEMHQGSHQSQGPCSHWARRFGGLRLD